MHTVAGPNPLEVREADGQLRLVDGSMASEGSVIVTDGQTPLMSITSLKTVRGSAYKFSDYRETTETDSGVAFSKSATVSDVVSKTPYNDKQVEALLSESCAGCGESVAGAAVMTIGPRVWVHATCIRPLFSAIGTPVRMYGKETFDFTRQPVSHRLHEQPPVCLRRTPFGGYKGSTYFGSDMEPVIESDEYYINSGLLGIAPKELSGYVDRLRNPPVVGDQEQLGARNGKAPWYLPSGCPDGIEALPEPNDVFAYDGDYDAWGNDWFIEMIREALETSCAVCNESFGGDSAAYLLDADNRCWCHSGCSATLANALESAWDGTDVLLGNALDSTER